MRRCKQTVIVILTKGFVALIDRADWKVVKKYSWHTHIGKGKNRCPGQPYARGRVNGKKVYLHVFLMQPPPGYQTDHNNRQTLDCRRVNLENVTHIENNHRRRNVKRKKTHDDGRPAIHA